MNLQRRTAVRVGLTWLTLQGVLLGAIGSVRVVTSQQDQPQPVGAVAEMRHHLFDVTRLHEAVIRADLPDARSAAYALSRMQTPPAHDVAGERFVQAIRTEARLAEQALDLAAAASATAQILGACGACHLAAGQIVNTSASERSLSTLVGAMREHRRAVDELLLGLVVPSARLWSQGAERLASEPLSTAAGRPDPDFADSVREADARLRQLAAAASRADSTPARTAIYAQLLATCAACHGLYGDRDSRGSPPAGPGS